MLCSPDHFDVVYAINPHMVGDDGRLSEVDRPRAVAQWHGLKNAYERLGVEVNVIPGVAGLPDMVFTANQTFPWRTADGSLHVLLSSMASVERRPEVPYFRRWYEERGYTIHVPDPSWGLLEGMGDLLWHPTRPALLGGHGFRTSERALIEIEALVGVPVVPLRLVDPRWYHLDTCLAPLDGSRALVCPKAFDPVSWDAIEDLFPDWISPVEDEGERGFACNLHVVGGESVIIDDASPRTAVLLEELGWNVVRLPMTEFRKSGGSVFCLKMELPRSES